MNYFSNQLSNIIRSLKTEEIWASFAALAAASVAPNIFPAAQAGYAKMSDLALWLLIPSIAFLAAVIVYSYFRKLQRLTRRIWVGVVVGACATFGLEAVRYPGFLMGWMPGNLPQLMGVLITDSFMQGPTFRSDVLGFLYHFWNGACFGMIYTIICGKKPFYWGVGFSAVIGVGFLASPVVKSLGVGFMGMEMPMMPVTVMLAHLVYGLGLGLITQQWLRSSLWLFKIDSSEAVVEQDVKTNLVTNA